MLGTAPGAEVGREAGVAIVEANDEEALLRQAVEEGIGPDGELRAQAHDQQQGADRSLSPAVSYSISMPLAFARATFPPA